MNQRRDVDTEADFGRAVWRALEDIAARLAEGSATELEIALPFTVAMGKSRSGASELRSATVRDLNGKSGVRRQLPEERSPQGRSPEERSMDGERPRQRRILGLRSPKE